MIKPYLKCDLIWSANLISVPVAVEKYDDLPVNG